MEYYIKVGDEKRGPYSLNELVERNLEATTLVMPTDGTEWVQANQIEELRTLFENKESTNEAANKEEIPFVHRKRKIDNRNLHQRRSTTLHVSWSCCFHSLS